MSTRVVRHLFESREPRTIYDFAGSDRTRGARSTWPPPSGSALPVTQGADLLGFFPSATTSGNRCRNALRPGMSSSRTSSTTHVIYVSSDTPIREYMELMSHHRFRHLPVVDDRTLVGILSISDIVRALRPARIGARQLTRCRVSRTHSCRSVHRSWGCGRDDLHHASGSWTGLRAQAAGTQRLIHCGRRQFELPVTCHLEIPLRPAPLVDDVVNLDMVVSLLERAGEIPLRLLARSCPPAASAASTRPTIHT